MNLYNIARLADRIDTDEIVNCDAAKDMPMHFAGWKKHAWQAPLSESSETLQ